MPFASRPLATCLPWLAAALLTTGCGGGSGGSGDSGSGGGGFGTSDSARAQAATATAQSSSNACNAIRPFYWEIGDATAAKASGSVGGSTYTSTTSVRLASASKWLYGAFVVEQRGGTPTPTDIEALTFRSGYTSFTSCGARQTVDDCLNSASNNVRTPANVGKFYYDGGHMQHHASVEMGLGARDNLGLATELMGALGPDLELSYNQPQLAGGGQGSGAGYASFLRRLLVGASQPLQIGAKLGQSAACTNPVTCTDAVATPIPSSESWHYGLGHWVEDDPTVGDGAFSSAGAFGFYPWVNQGRTLYGLLVRDMVEADAGYRSAQCGRLIRKAWVSGTAQ